MSEIQRRINRVTGVTRRNVNRNVTRRNARNTFRRKSSGAWAADLATDLFDPVKTQARVTDAVLVGFSCGKDSIVTLDLCFRHFKRVQPFFMAYVPGMDFQERMIQKYEKTVRCGVHPNAAL